MTRVSVDWKGRQFNGTSGSPGVSAAVKFIVFLSTATNVIKGGASPACGHIYRRGPTSASIRLVDRNAQGQYANLTSQRPEVSADGRYVTYTSFGSDLTKGVDDNGTIPDIFRTGPF